MDTCPSTVRISQSLRSMSHCTTKYGFVLSRNRQVQKLITTTKKHRSVLHTQCPSTPTRRASLPAGEKEEGKPQLRAAYIFNEPPLPGREWRWGWSRGLGTGDKKEEESKTEKKKEKKNFLCSLGRLRTHRRGGDERGRKGRKEERGMQERKYFIPTFLCVRVRKGCSRA